MSLDKKNPFLAKFILHILMYASFTILAISYSFILNPGLVLIHYEQSSSFGYWPFEQLHESCVQML
jgi:hypothetical protein